MRVHHDTERLRALLQDLPLHGDSARAAVRVRGRAVAGRRRGVHQELLRRLPGGAIIVLACVIYSVFASSPPPVDTGAAAVTQVWGYVGGLIFNMLILVGTVKMADRVVRELMGL